MNVRRAEVLMIEFPFHEGSGSKLRPAVVVQSDQDNVRLGTTVVAMITKNTMNSVVNGSQLVTVGDDQIDRHLGFLPPPLMQQVENALRQGLGL